MKLTPAMHAIIWSEASAAGNAALAAATPSPMVVEQHASVLDDASPVVQRYVVEGGVCGFAWVHISPGTHSFARWAKKLGIGHKAYYGGLDLWVHEGGQSMERKMAWASAAATVLKAYGIPASTGSRMD